MTEYIVIASTLILAKPEIVAGCVECLLRVLFAMRRESKVIILQAPRLLQTRRRKRKGSPKAKRQRIRKNTSRRRIIGNASRPQSDRSDLVNVTLQYD